MTAFRIVLPLGIVAIIAGLIIGNTNISLASSHGVYCGSAFGGGSGTLNPYVEDTLNPYVEEECAPLLSEHQLWATVFLVLGMGLLISSAVLYRANQPSPATVKANPLPPPPGAVERGWYPDPAGTGKQRTARNGVICR
jgi:hypothetical protein